MAKIIEPNLAVNKKDSEQDKRLRELKNMTLPSTLAQAGGSVKSRGDTCRQLRLRQQIGIETIGRRSVGTPSILHGLMIRDLNTMLAFHHANTRGSRLHIFVSRLELFDATTTV